MIIKQSEMVFFSFAALPRKSVGKRDRARYGSKIQVNSGKNGLLVYFHLLMWPGVVTLVRELAMGKHWTHRQKSKH